MKNEVCAAQHFGYWMVEPKWLQQMVTAYNAGTLPKAVVDEDDDTMYAVDETGIATIGIRGQTTRGKSSFGGTSTVAARRALRMAEADTDVRGIMLAIDSPGGTVAGQQDFADEIYRIRAISTKPLFAHADGNMHSAALWAGVQAQRVTASPMSEIGSIGTVASVADWSEHYKNEGIKVHVISTGEMKGAFTPGTEVTDQMLSELQDRVNAMNEFFLNAVKRGRGMGIADVRAMADGRDWMAADAQQKGLVDGVMTLEEAVGGLRREVRSREIERQNKSRETRRRARLASL